MKQYLLIGDPEDDILRTSPIAAAPDMPVAMYGKTLRDCQRRLTSPDTNFIGLFFNPSLGHPGWVSILRAAITSHPNCPVFLVCSEPPPFSAAELDKLKITKVLRKPLTYDQILAEVGVAQGAPKTLLSTAATRPDTT